MISPLLRVLETVEREVQELDKLFQEYAENHAVCQNLMTIPGIGSITVVAFTTSIDDPKRFRKSRSVGAYVGLTNRRDQSGERDIAGRISGRGDKLLRSYLYAKLIGRSSSETKTRSWLAAIRVARFWLHRHAQQVERACLDGRRLCEFIELES